MFVLVRRAAGTIRETEEVRTLVSIFSLDTLPDQSDLVLERGQRGEVIIAAEAFDSLVFPAGGNRHGSGGARERNMTVYRRDDDISVGLTLADDVGIVVPHGEQNVPWALVETENASRRKTSRRRTS